MKSFKILKTHFYLNSTVLYSYKCEFLPHTPGLWKFDSSHLQLLDNMTMVEETENSKKE